MKSRLIRIPQPGDGIAAMALDEQQQMLTRPPELSLHDWAVFLLHTAAEVEHALLVQYLYAAYSIKPLPIPGTNPVIQTSQWQREIVKIAKEEMGHLLTLQNILRFVGGPPNLEREDFPMRTQFYPFPFVLERFTRDSLAKYVFAEMPEGPIDPAILTPDERTEIEERAKTATGTAGALLNHVGTLYRTLDQVFNDAELDGFRTNRFHFQARAQDPWSQTVVTPAPGQFPTGVVLSRLTSRHEAVAALSSIARQGEAASGSADLMKSHFGRFLSIYRAFPDGFVPSYPVATNPNTNQANPTAGTITNAETLAWAQLFNIRYRILLNFISHSVLIPATVPGQPDELDPVSGNGLVVQWVYEEMVQASGSIRDLARKLAQLPLTTAGTATAGAPFELPYTLALPDQEPERWRVHADQIAATAGLIALLKAPPINSTDPMLDEILANDAARLPEIEARMNAS